MPIEAEIRELAAHYSAMLKEKIAERKDEMQSDDTSHYMIYLVLGISLAEGELIDIYQNKGRFLYKYAGSFLKEAAKLCFRHLENVEFATKIPNTIGSRPRSFEIDCLSGNDAIEIQWRDATTEGEHIIKEDTRLRAVVSAGYHPIRVMFYYPSRAQAIRIQQALETLYQGIGGAYYYGEQAWEFVQAQTGVNLKQILTEIAAERINAS